MDAGYLEHRPKQRESGGDAAHDYRVVIDVIESPEQARTSPTKTVSDDDGFTAKGVPIDGQGCPPMDGQGVPTHERAPSITTPVKRSERERAQSGETTGGEIPHFDQAFRSWPTSISDSRPDALEAWERLDVDDRKKAVEEVGRYVNAYKAVGRKHLCSFATYLRERKWTGLPPAPKPAVNAPSEAPAKAVKQQPTSFQRAHPHLYPELFGRSDARETEGAEVRS